MIETSGTLNLKIAQLKHRLNVLQQHLTLSAPYPQLQAKLTQRQLQLESHLQQLQQCLTSHKPLL